MPERLGLGLIPGAGWRADEIRTVAREAEKPRRQGSTPSFRLRSHLAKSAALIADATGGRIVLGLGVSHQPVNRALGIEMPSPALALRKYAVEVASWLRGVGPTTHLPQQPSQYPVPIYLAALTSQGSNWQVRSPVA
jgi:alkanesulfonate monooxygenase SsuD/methylene tetrahydromethanopterin reductase-like flavin-dependent oxidoreductase (luciferase family)